MEVQELTIEEMKEVNGGSCGCKDRCDDCDDGISVELKLKLSVGLCL